MEGLAAHQVMEFGKFIAGVAVLLALLLKFARIEAGIESLVAELKRHTKQEEEYWQIVIGQKETIGRHSERLDDHERRITRLED